MELDLSKEESVVEAGKKILDLNIPISGLVNNAGIIINSLFQMTTSKLLKEIRPLISKTIESLKKKAELTQVKSQIL